MSAIVKDRQYFKFCGYGFLKNLRFFDAFFILFLIEKGLSYTEIGLLYAIREIFINILEVPSGILADSYGRKNALVLSFFAYILSFLWFYYAIYWGEFLGAFILYGIGDAFRSGTHKGMIMEYLKKNNWSHHKVSYYGHTRSWSQKGSALSSLVAGIVVFYSGSYQAIFLYSIVPYLLNALLILSYPQELNFSAKKEKKKGAKIKTTSKSFFAVMKQPNVLKIVSTAAFHSAYLKAVKDYIQPIMVNVAFLIPILLEVEPDKKSGLIIGVLYFFIFLATSTASKHASKIESKNKQNISYITLLMGFAFGIVCGAFWYYDLWVIALIAFIGIYIIENIRKPILTGAIADNVPNDILTSVISAQSLLKTALTAILAFVFGLMADVLGIGLALMFISLFLAFVSIGINLLTRKEVLD